MDLLNQLKGFKFVATLVLVFTKIERKDKTKYDTFYLHPKAETITCISDVNDVFQSIYGTIISGSSRIIKPVIDHTISILKYNLLPGSSYIKLSKVLDQLRKGLIILQIITQQELQKLIETF